MVFQEVSPGDLFIGGTALEHTHLFISGCIRDGRSAVDRKALIRRLTEDVATAAGVEPFSVWAYLVVHVGWQAGLDWPNSWPETIDQMQTMRYVPRPPAWSTTPGQVANFCC